MPYPYPCWPDTLTPSSERVLWQQGQKVSLRNRRSIRCPRRSLPSTISAGHCARDSLQQTRQVGRLVVARDHEAQIRIRLVTPWSRPRDPGGSPADVAARLEGARTSQAVGDRLVEHDIEIELAVDPAVRAQWCARQARRKSEGPPEGKGADDGMVFDRAIGERSLAGNAGHAPTGGDLTQPYIDGDCEDSGIPAECRRSRPRLRCSRCSASSDPDRRSSRCHRRRWSTGRRDVARRQRSRQVEALVPLGQMIDGEHGRWRENAVPARDRSQRRGRVPRDRRRSS